jgi:NAD(P)-dependent dehydrogenase (short-subunit alcohol dehydrogenase family)
LANEFVPLHLLFDLTDRVALVSGGAGWLGKAMCEALAEQNAIVCVAGRDVAKAESAIKEIKHSLPSAKLCAVELDITDGQSVQRCFSTIIKDHGRLNILVNNAHSGSCGSIETCNAQEWTDIFNTAVVGYFRCIQQALPAMRTTGGGVIVNVASMYGSVAPYPELYEGNDFLNPPAYGASKAAVIQLTRYCAVHLSKYRIRANCLSPGPFPGAVAQADNTFIERLKSKTALKRVGKPSELKGAMAYLASDASAYLTGHNLVVDGGWTSC